MWMDVESFKASSKSMCHSGVQSQTSHQHKFHNGNLASAMSAMWQKFAHGSG